MGNLQTLASAHPHSAVAVVVFFLLLLIWWYLSSQYKAACKSCNEDSVYAAQYGTNPGNRDLARENRHERDRYSLALTIVTLAMVADVVFGVYAYFCL